MRDSRSGTRKVQGSCKGTGRGGLAVTVSTLLLLSGLGSGWPPHSLAQPAMAETFGDLGAGGIEARRELELLYEALRDAADGERADVLAEEIRRRWRETAGPTARLLLQQAADLIEAEALLQARAKLTGVVQFNPGYAEGWARRGALLLDMDDLEGALTDLQKAVDLDPSHFDAQALIGTIREREGRWRLALEAYSAAVAAYPYWERPSQRLRMVRGIVRQSDVPSGSDQRDGGSAEPAPSEPGQNAPEGR